MEYYLYAGTTKQTADALRLLLVLFAPLQQTQECVHVLASARYLFSVQFHLTDIFLLSMPLTKLATCTVVSSIGYVSHTLKLNTSDHIYSP